MLSPHFRKFTDIYEKYGIGAVKKFWLLTCLIPLGRTLNLNKLKDFVDNSQIPFMEHLEVVEYLYKLLSSKSLYPRSMKKQMHLVLL
jgi:hypothetical protein